MYLENYTEDKMKENHRAIVSDHKARFSEHFRITNQASESKRCLEAKRTAKAVEKSSYERHTVDALASGVEEGRDKLRKAVGSRK